MNAHLLFRDRILKKSQLDDQLAADLELPVLIREMAARDQYVAETVRQVLSSENQCQLPSEIIYRQEILKDCIDQEDRIRTLYRQASQAAGRNQDTYLSVTHKKARYMLDVAVRVMLSMQAPLKEIWQTASGLADLCQSQGMQQLLQGLIALFEPDRLNAMGDLMGKLSVRDQISAVTSPGDRLRGEIYHPLAAIPARKKGLLRIFRKGKDSFEFDVDMNDPESVPALSKLRDSMSAGAASIIVQARDELFEFLDELKRELSFYIGCLNIRKRMDQLKIPSCWPAAGEGTEEGGRNVSSFYCSSLYNLTLSVLSDSACVPVTVEETRKRILMITGPNQGGKTTFLRSLGQALVMMNSGMPVPAESFGAETGRIYTHFIREEDRSLRSGKLDEELIRMSSIIDQVRPGDWLLCNESFSSTNEEEGSRIAMEIVTALHDQKIHVAYVTHFYQLVTLLLEGRPKEVLYLNAARQEDGNRTYQLQAGEPEVKGYGEDLFKEIFVS